MNSCFDVVFFLVRIKEGSLKERTKGDFCILVKVRRETRVRDGRVGVNQLVGAWHPFKCGAQSKSPNQYSIAHLSEASYSNFLIYFHIWIPVCPSCQRKIHTQTHTHTHTHTHMSAFLKHSLLFHFTGRLLGNTCQDWRAVGGGIFSA